MNLFENLQMMKENKNNIYNSLLKEIKDLKIKLKNSKIKENFGENEIRELKFKYNDFMLQDVDHSEKMKILSVIKNFEEWCMTYTGKNENVNLTDEQRAIINIANDDIDSYEGGSKPFKYSYSITGYQDALGYIKDVMELSDTELEQAIDEEIRNISLSHEYESKEIKKEAKYNSNINTSDELYTEIQKMLRDASLDEDTISLNDLFNCYSMEALQDLYDFLSSEYDYDDDYIGIITNNNDLWYEFNKLLSKDYVKLDDLFNCFSFDRLKELYDYISSEYEDDYEWYNNEEEIEESTSGIGGAYTTQAIDILPKGIKKVNENLYDEYLEKVMDEKNNAKLVKLLDEIKDNKDLKDEDKKKLKKEIKDKAKTLKTEAITEFYGKEFNDDIIKDKIEFTKSHPDEFMALKYLDSFEYEGVLYYIVSDGKYITYDNKDCEVYLLVDEDLNKYLGYFEVTFEETGDPENGPDLDASTSDIPYKIIKI